MNVSAGQRLEDQIASAAQNQKEFVAFLINYNSVTQMAAISTAPNATMTVNVAVSPRVQTFTNLLVANARVVVTTVGNNKPIITDVLDLLLSKPTMLITPKDGMFGKDRQVVIRGFSPDEALLFEFEEVADEIQSPANFTFNISADANGNAIFTFNPLVQLNTLLGITFTGNVALIALGAKSRLSCQFVFYVISPLNVID